MSWQTRQALFNQQQRYAANRGEVLRSFVALYLGPGGGWRQPKPGDYVDEETRQQMRHRTKWGDLLDEPPKRD